MKRAQAETKLDSMFLSFGESISAYLFDSNFSVTAFKDAHRALAARVEKLKEFLGTVGKRRLKPARSRE